MTSSIGSPKPRKKLSWQSLVFWLLVWEVLAKAVGKSVILSSPVEVLMTLFKLVLTKAFYSAILFSFIRIASGFLLGTLAGVLLAGLSYRLKSFEKLVEPMMRTIKSIPVASFIIIVLLWISPKNLAIAISFLIVLPVIYSNTLEGLRMTSPNLLEMAKVFRVTGSKRVRYIYVPEVFPYFRAACSVALGLAWKSGVAAEVIGLPMGSMGEKLYQSKIFLDTPALMAWTAVIVFVSYIFEKLVLLLLNSIQKGISR